MKMLHIITGLNTGGAETMLYRLLAHMDRALFEPEVISLMDIGPIGKKIQAMGIPVRALGMRQGIPNPLHVIRLIRWLKKDPPHVIQTWMYHADLIGGLAAKLVKDISVNWGIHHSNLDPEYTKRSTIWTVRACAFLSKWLPDQIVSCSEASRRLHIEWGYPIDRIIVIPNGFDYNTHKPDPRARLTMRRELEISDETPLIGLIARFSPLKDHFNFIEAASLLHLRLSEAHFLLCGDDVVWGNTELAGWIKSANIHDRCHLLGRRDDVHQVMAALDIASSSSSGEAFPLVIGEAMLCGVPCVVTDVGDSALIVGETGKVVPPKDPQSLACAWFELLKMEKEQRKQLGILARQRVIENFSLDAVVHQYQMLYLRGMSIKGELPANLIEHRDSQ